MIIAVGISYYNVRTRVESRSSDILQLMTTQDMEAADENLVIQYVALTGGNSLNLTIKNTGSILSQLEWIGVFDDTLNTKAYYKVDTSISPLETQIDIGNASIAMNPANMYTIQVLTRLGNIYYGEYPMPVTPGGGGGGGGVNTTVLYYSEYAEVDLHPDTAVGTHSFFSAMKTGPNGLTNNITEALPVLTPVPTTLISESFEGVWLPTGWTEVPGGNRWNKESDQVYSGAFSADYDGVGGGSTGSLISPVINTAGGTSFTIDFWYRTSTGVGPNEYLLEFWDGAVWNTIADLSAGAQNTWLHYTLETTDPQYLSASFQIRWRATGIANGQSVWLDLLAINSVSAPPSTNYWLDLEVMWIGLPQKTYEYLMIYGDAQDAEALRVDVWFGGQWVTIIPDIQPGWNTVDITPYLTGSVFNIRFRDTLRDPDTTQSRWIIDAMYLNLFN
jgi:hypothetical protein